MYFCVFCFVERRVQNICSHRIFTFYLFFYIYYGGDKRGGDVGWRGGGWGQRVPSTVGRGRIGLPPSKNSPD